MNSSVFAMKTSGGSVKVVLDGNHYLKNNNAEAIFEAAMSLKMDPSEENREVLENLLDPNYRQVALGIFERDNSGRLYLPGTKTPIPTTIRDLAVEYNEQGLDVTPLKKFWAQALQNPNSDAREGFFKYCRDYGVTITDEGYALLYKAVNRNPAANMDEEFVDFVAIEYLKAIRKDKDPASLYVVREDIGLSIVEEEEIYEEVLTLDPSELSFTAMVRVAYVECVIDELYRHDDLLYVEYNDADFSCNNRESYPFPQIEDELRQVFAETEENDNEGSLEDLYETITTSGEGQFQPWYSGGDYGVEINLGEVVPMPREKCDPNIDKACSKGLHVGSHRYVENFGSDMDTILACLVSPRDIVALPRYDHSKIRTCRYLPFGVMERTERGGFQEVESVHVNVDYIEEDFDVEGALQELQEKDVLTEAEEDRRALLENRVTQLA